MPPARRARFRRVTCRAAPRRPELGVVTTHWPPPRPRPRQRAAELTHGKNRAPGLGCRVNTRIGGDDATRAVTFLGWGCPFSQRVVGTGQGRRPGDRRDRRLCWNSVAGCRDLSRVWARCQRGNHQGRGVSSAVYLYLLLGRVEPLERRRWAGRWVVLPVCC